MPPGPPICAMLPAMAAVFVIGSLIRFAFWVGWMDVVVKCCSVVNCEKARGCAEVTLNSLHKPHLAPRAIEFNSPQPRQS